MGEPLFRARGCFVCGTENPGGLNVGPEREGKKVFVRFTPGETHRGFSKAVHGGITASLLDEVVGVAAGQRTDGKCATVELLVAYKRPLIVGVEVRAEGWYVRRQGKLVLGAGRVIDAAGTVLATARGKFLPLDEKQVSRFVGNDGE
ncbi:MAG: thioesterase superfamily protein [Myxococcales bacterium]|nr:thioesterase superfamily protein [Myxococcales bacterium]